MKKKKKTVCGREIKYWRNRVTVSYFARKLIKKKKIQIQIGFLICLSKTNHEVKT